jgi:hypothetical protein
MVVASHRGLITGALQSDDHQPEVSASLAFLGHVSMIRYLISSSATRLFLPLSRLHYS